MIATSERRNIRSFDKYHGQKDGFIIDLMFKLVNIKLNLALIFFFISK